MTEERQKARDQIFRAARQLSGDGPRRPRQVLAALAEEAGAEERGDSYGSGEMIENFEAEIASILGKEAAVFLPSGTMAQQIALRIWTDRAGRRTVGWHPTCHLDTHEEFGYRYLHGLQSRHIGDAGRIVTLADLEAVPEPLGALLLELPQREIGGHLPTWEELQAQSEWARSRGIALHMDGARLWESAPFYDRTYSEIAALFDSVYVSFYKGIGAIAGAALAGPADFIREARVWIRRHGGNLVQLYPYVLSARAGLRDKLPRFQGYHDRAVSLAAALSVVPGLAISPNPPHANRMHVYLQGEPEALLDAAAEVAQADDLTLFRWAWPAAVPGWSTIEIAIGEAAATYTDAEAADAFRRVLERAGDQQCPQR